MDSYNPTDLDAAALLCVEAGRDPDEELTRFVLLDYASALLEEGLEREEILDRIRRANASRLGDAIVDASHWMEILPWLDVSS